MSDRIDVHGNNMKIFEEYHLYTSDQKLNWWGNGEWVEEVDYSEFEYKGFKCKIIRMCERELCSKEEHYFGGFFCGYVRIPNDHKLFNINYDDIHVDIHYGLTYGSMEENEEYWIGFDCAHVGDLVPSTEFLRKKFNISDDILPKFPEFFKKYGMFNPIYRNIEFCKNECKSIVDQI